MAAEPDVRRYTSDYIQNALEFNFKKWIKENIVKIILFTAALFSTIVVFIQIYYLVNEATPAFEGTNNYGEKISLKNFCKLQKILTLPIIFFIVTAYSSALGKPLFFPGRKYL